MIQWGILGYGNIAKRFIKGLSFSEEGSLYAVASHSLANKEKKDLDEHVKIYATYEELLNDENVDAVYIALRHADHYHYAKEALLKNKAVLCEKPATLTYEQTKELCELSKQKHTFFMEAMKSRFIPMMDEIKKLVDQGVIGEIQSIESSFCSEVPYMERSYLFDLKQGGALYDVGIYNIALTLDFIHSPLRSLEVHSQKYYGVDGFDQIELTFESGQKAYIEAAIDRNKEKAMTIKGTLGTIKATPFYRPETATVEFINGESFTGEKPYVYDDFYGEIEEVHRCLGYALIKSPRMSHQDSLDCVELMEKIKESMHE